jgi:hypothetical protein
MSVPKWPDFSIERIGQRPDENGRYTYSVKTDTGRPKTPIFQLWMSMSKDFSEGERRMLAREELMHLYRNAHPRGCPGGH